MKGPGCIELEQEIIGDLIVVAFTPSDAEISAGEKELKSKMVTVHHLGETLASKSIETKSEKKDAATAAESASVPWAPSTESQRLSPQDPRSKPSVFAWLWKASDPVPINTGNSQVLAGNGTEAEGGSTNVTEAVSVEEAAKENHDAAKKELALSQDKEMRFFAIWTVAILVVLGVGLCSIKYARSILGGAQQRPPPPRPPQGMDNQGSYGAVGAGYPPR